MRKSLKQQNCEAVLTSTHNLCFGAKIRKIGIPLHTPVCYIKVGYKGVYILHGHVILKSIFKVTLWVLSPNKIFVFHRKRGRDENFEPNGEPSVGKILLLLENHHHHHHTNNVVFEQVRHKPS